MGKNGLVIVLVLFFVIFLGQSNAFESRKLIETPDPNGSSGVNQDSLSSSPPPDDNKKPDLSSVEAPKLNDSLNTSPSNVESEVCKGLPVCSDHEKTMIACIQDYINGSNNLSLVVQNEKDVDLKVNITFGISVNNNLPTFEIPAHGTKKVNITLSGDKSNKVVLNAGNGDCELQISQPKDVSDPADSPAKPKDVNNTVESPTKPKDENSLSKDTKPDSPSKSKDVEDPSKSKDIDDPSKSKDVNDPSKSKDIDDPSKLKSKDDNDPSKSKDVDNPSKDVNDPSKSKDADDTSKPKDVDDPSKPKSKDVDDPSKPNTKDVDDPSKPKSKDVDDPSKSKDVNDPSKSKDTGTPSNPKTSVDTPISQNNFLDQLTFYSKQVTPIYGAYLAFLVALIIGGSWALCTFRKRRAGNGVPYQELEMGTTEPSNVVDVETAEGWDHDWDDDDWDEDEAIRSSGGGVQTNPISSNGLTSRATKKDGWDADWDD